MRKIGHLPDSKLARAFGDALFVRGIENDIEDEDDGSFSIWVHDDDQRDKAAAMLEEFRHAPGSAEWSDAAKAEKLRREQEKEDARRASNVITRERMEYERNFTGFAGVPMILAVLSVLVTIFAGELEFQILPTTGEQREQRRSDYFYINRTNTYAEMMRRIKAIEDSPASGATAAERIRQYEEFTREVTSGRSGKSIRDIQSGEVWRLFTPMFLHFGILHLIFNLMWLRDLGSFMQHRFGPGYLLAFVLASAAVSNLAQLAWNGPHFGGMSGVNYALFGFLWLRGKFDRTAVWRLNPVIVQTMLIWFVVCFTGLVGNIANTAHAVGLIFGMAAGFLTAKMATRRRM